MREASLIGSSHTHAHTNKPRILDTWYFPNISKIKLFHVTYIEMETTHTHKFKHTHMLDNQKSLWTNNNNKICKFCLDIFCFGNFVFFAQIERRKRQTRREKRKMTKKNRRSNNHSNGQTVSNTQLKLSTEWHRRISN